MKIVIDTNVIASGIFWTGPPLTILEAFFDKLIDLVITQEIFDEYSKVFTLLSHKYDKDISDIIDAIKI